MRERAAHIRQRHKANRRRFGIKRYMPASLFARALLILLVPVVTLQLLVAYVFYARHWDSVVRNMSGSAASEVAMLLDEYHELSYKLGTAEALRQTVDRGKMLGVGVTFRKEPDVVVIRGEGREKFPDFYDAVAYRIPNPLMILPSDATTIHVRVSAVGGALELHLPRKRLASSTTGIFILWMVGSALLLTTIAILFLRNQVRPIVQLARAAEQFGLGQDVQDFSPRGASEVRRAGRAFVVMADRLRRQVQSRTEMLAGISHDLRTPLTRMKLEIEMGSIDPATRDALATDIDEMRSMIDEYLDFARGDAGEPMEPMDVAALMADVAHSYARQGHAVTMLPAQATVIALRPQALRRALTNLIDNALRYGGGVAELSLEQSLTFVRLKVSDRGTGIAEAQQEEVFKPFTRLEPSRNHATGGVGLGLSIARAVAQSHGGDVTLENRRDGDGRVTGLEVTLRLPQALQNLDA